MNRIRSQSAEEDDSIEICEEENNLIEEETMEENLEHDYALHE